MTNDLVATLRGCLPWTPATIPEDIPHGDMPGDQVSIAPSHIAKATRLFPLLVEQLLSVLDESGAGRAVVAVAGRSGVGKSEIASLVSFHLRTIGIGCYTLSGDNYPRRIPAHNDAERLRVYRQGGLRGMVESVTYTAERAMALRRLSAAGADADPGRTAEDPWLAVYQQAGRTALRGYLGTPAEIDFDELSGVVGQFRDGADAIWLKRMGRAEADLWYDHVDFSAVRVLVIEWTHGMSSYLQGVHVHVLLTGTPAETLAHRRARNRDGATDSPFTTTVLQIEQELLDTQAKKARIILSKGGDPLSYDQYRRATDQTRSEADA